MMQTEVETIVIGAGLSGLTAAYRLFRSGHRVLVLEASSRAGGLIQTLEQDGFIAEAGPNTFPSTASHILELCQELNLQPQVAQAAHRRYLFLQGRLVALPHNPLSFLTSPVLSFAGKLRLLQEPWIAKSDAEDSSVAEFFTRRLGAESVQNLIDPFISGIYAGDIQRLSLPAVFPKLWEWEQATGSILKGMLRQAKQKRGTKGSRMKLLSFPCGLQTLTDALARALPMEMLRLNASVRRLERHAEMYTVHLASGETLHARRLVLATPAFVSAALLADLAPTVSRELADIPYPSLTVVHTGFQARELPHPLDGFGFLIPRKENVPLLGSIWASSLFPNRVPPGKILLSNFIGGAHAPELAHAPAEHIQQLVVESLEKVFKPKSKLSPGFCRVLSYSQAIPQYSLGHVSRVRKIEAKLKRLPNLTLCGNYLHGISLEHCVQWGLNAVKDIG
jgi:oxygen-dependent protoporphyrinogen oxidase